MKKVLFMPTNGAGLGHLTRMLAIAKRLKKLHPSIEIIFFTTSQAMHLIQKEGFFAYYLPSKSVCPSYVTGAMFNSMLKEQLISILRHHNITTLVFDGSFPYNGLTEGMQCKPNLKKIWIQRGQNKKGKTAAIKQKEKLFDIILIPGELNKKNPSLKNKKYQYCPPIIYLEKKQLLKREAILKMWNLNPKKKTVFIQLGAGKINDVNNLIHKIINNLKRRKDIQIVLGESIIAKSSYPIDSQIYVLKDYPTSKYSNAFDFAISASGYNTFHEMIYFQVPTIFFPNLKTQADNQFERSKTALELGTGLLLTRFDEFEFHKAVSAILNPHVNATMRANCANKFKNGANTAAQIIFKNIMK